MKIKVFSYKKGITLPKIKSLTVNTEAAQELAAPNYVYVSCKQIKGLLPKPVVVKGDKVKIGSVIARVGDNVIYSPVSGEVQGIEALPSVYGSIIDNVVIKNDKKDKTELLISPKENYNKEELLEALRKSAIIDYDGFTLHSEINIEYKYTSLIINAVTDEPYETNNIELIRFYLQDVLNAAYKVMEALNIKNLYLAISKDFYGTLKDVIKSLPAEYSESLNLYLLPPRYPVGDEKELRVVVKAKVEDTLIMDIYALKSVGDLLKQGYCDNKRLITLYDATGKKATETTVWVTVGTSIEEVVNGVRPEGFEGVRKLVAGGPMRGTALGSEKASVTKGLKSIILFGEHIKDVKKEVPCINCGMCDKVCPVNISPMQLDKVIINSDMVTAKEMCVEKCTRCGACSYVCPSKRYLTQRMQYAKEFIKDKGI